MDRNADPHKEALLGRPSVNDNSDSDVDEIDSVTNNTGPSPATNFASINAYGPQFCYSPLLGSGPSSRSQSPSSENPEREQPEEYRVYKRRWYILLLYSVLAGSQSAVWNTFGPISSTAEDAFGWNDSTIALLSNWGPITYLIAGMFFSWVLDVKGLRVACLLTAFLVSVGTGVRCITMEPPAVTWLMNLGQALNGLGGPVAMAGPPAVSAIWFPPHQRATATAVGSFLGNMGTALGFILGPLLVPDVQHNSTNTSALWDVGGHGILPSSWEDSTQFNGTDLNLTWSECGPSSWTQNSVSGQNSSCLSSEEHTVKKERHAIALYMYIEAGWCCLLLLLIVLYFPKKPPTPPCTSANIQRYPFLQGLRQLFMCQQQEFWILGFVYGLSLGVFNAWCSVLDVILKPHGIGEKEAGWIGFYAICGGAAVSIIVARFSDIFSRKMKWTMMFCYLIATGAFAVFVLAVKNVIPSSTALLYTTIIGGSTALCATNPLIFELACELAYPTGEGVANGVLTILNNIAGIVFLLMFMIPGIGSMWTNYALVAATGVCLPLLLIMRERYNRLEIDEISPSLTAEVIVSA